MHRNRTVDLEVCTCHPLGLRKEVQRLFSQYHWEEWKTQRELTMLQIGVRYQEASFCKE